MDPITTLDASVASRHLLNHTFYQRWTDGTLTREELRDYAGQYFHYAMAFPTFISAMHQQTEDIVVRQMLLENLIEEERGAENHPELWLRFCESLGLDREEVKAGIANDATRGLIATMKSLARDGALHEGLAALYAYESQIPAVAKAKIEGLAQNYAISADRDVAFFRVHMDADVMHSETSRSILRDLCDTPEKTAAADAAAKRTLDALYGFLDSVTAN
ncbi:MAG TPA: CADD family putative folate metabolism protein [Thermoanaerobaculia bacterium]|jgi:pyrroloquinoline-quinone synthase|nr:CADD family putative folate metabolism protein [Thermoanaerobaculia bacterium]